MTDKRNLVVAALPDNLKHHFFNNYINWEKSTLGFMPAFVYGKTPFEVNPSDVDGHIEFEVGEFNNPYSGEAAEIIRQYMKKNMKGTKVDDGVYSMKRQAGTRVSNLINALPDEINERRTHIDCGNCGFQSTAEVWSGYDDEVFCEECLKNAGEEYDERWHTSVELPTFLQGMPMSIYVFDATPEVKWFLKGYRYNYQSGMHEPYV